MRKTILALTLGLTALTNPLAIKAEVDPNFYIYLCFGQSNMEGNAKAESMDNTVEYRHTAQKQCCKFKYRKRQINNIQDLGSILDFGYKLANNGACHFCTHNMH